MVCRCRFDKLQAHGRGVRLGGNAKLTYTPEAPHPQIAIMVRVTEGELLTHGTRIAGKVVVITGGLMFVSSTISPVSTCAVDIIYFWEREQGGRSRT